MYLRSPSCPVYSSGMLYRTFVDEAGSLSIQIHAALRLPLESQMWVHVQEWDSTSYSTVHAHTIRLGIQLELCVKQTCRACHSTYSVPWPASYASPALETTSSRWRSKYLSEFWKRNIPHRSASSLEKRGSGFPERRTAPFVNEPMCAASHLCV